MNFKETKTLNGTERTSEIKVFEGNVTLTYVAEKSASFTYPSTDLQT